MDFDVAVVGGGIAGVSAAAALAESASVVLLEQEQQLAYHTTGRSAAAFLETYGSPTVRALTRASRAALATSDATGRSKLSPRPQVWVASATHVAELDRLVSEEPLLAWLSEPELARRCPMLRPGWAVAAAIEADAQDLDVAGLFEAYRRLALQRGAVLRTSAGVRAARRHRDGWRLGTDPGPVTASVVVNAAGAWADQVGAMFGAAVLGLTPLRRSVAVVTCPGVDRSWPLVADIAERFYFRPEGDALLISPAEQTPVEPGDARPEPEWIALALERVNEATTLNLRHVRTAWAGLRTFAPDRAPVVGFDPRVEGLFWLCGQGGYGIQTAPAMAMLAAALVLGQPLPAELAAEGVDPGALGPSRCIGIKPKVASALGETR
jgi:D-arginine dehydrogenase